jgi:predicted RecB family nuclease
MSELHREPNLDDGCRRTPLLVGVEGCARPAGEIRAAGGRFRRWRHSASGGGVRRVQLRGDHVLYSASDVVDACLCPVLPTLERTRLSGALAFEPASSPEQELVAREAALHEQKALEAFAQGGRAVVRVPGATPEAAAAETERAMASGADVIYQGVLLDTPWLGRPDFLVKVPGESRFGGFRYEVLDAKLARRARSQALVQGAVYSLLLKRAQGAAPDRVHLWLGTGQMASFRAADFTAYAELARRRLLDAPRVLPATAPDVVPHCAQCRFLRHCDDWRRREDHLFSLPGIQKRQIARLRQRGITTVAELAREDPEGPGIISRPSPADGRLIRLARLRMQERETGRPCHALRPVEPGRGLARLPEPSPGDVFFDLEGDPFAPGGGLEYLWGWLERGSGGWGYRHRWAHTPTEERAAFAAFVDRVMELRRRHPGMHVYHYAAYEVSALKRLSGRYGTREAAIDELLRGQVFVDLYRVVHEALLVSRESYSIKDLEPLYMPERRQAEVKTSVGSIVAYDLWKSTGEAAVLEEIRAYNDEDCRSTAALRDWLESLRQEAGVAHRPVVTAGEASAAVRERDAALGEAAAALEGEVAEGGTGRALLAGLLHWYRREQKSQWWAYFSRMDASDEELVEDPDCIGGLELQDQDDDLWTFRFDPSQEFTLRIRDQPCDPASGQTVGTIVDLDPRRGEVTLRSRQDLGRLRALIPGKPLNVSAQEGALMRLAEALAAWGSSGEGPYRHLRDLLAGAPPRFRGVPTGAVLQGEGDDSVAVATRLALALNGSTLAVQGPPGTGKTTLAGVLIAELMRAGRSVGITAQSHKVIGNLLHAVDRALGRGRGGIRGVQRAPEGQGVALPWVVQARDNRAVVHALNGGARLVAGTAWLFAREEMDSRLDVLVVDEAGQYSLADAVASGTAARNLILVGDPQQLRQVVQGSHPPGVAVSALEHVLAGRATMPPERGLFLPVTRRLHPDIAAFISAIAYEGRLDAAPACGERRMEGPPPWGTAHLCYIPVHHEGNRRTSDEEVAAVVRAVDELLRCRFRDEAGHERPLGVDDILVVAPFNAHVQRLMAALPAGARVGTVDRFQGQEAPVVIYSTAASDPEHLPHGMEFLFSLNRLNVAISRAQVLAVLVGSPALLSAWSEDPERLRLVNALCRFVLRATDLPACGGRAAGRPGRLSSPGRGG